MTVRILIGDVREQLRTLPDQSVHCVVTSPPYWGLRDYGVAGQIGLEATPQEFVATMTDVFREVRRVLRDDGTCWVNMGDSYAASRSYQVSDNKNPGAVAAGHESRARPPLGLKQKDLVGMPWRLAFALQDDGWYLRQDIIWHKPNPMPESVRDRCTKAHEYIFLLSKNERYYFDQQAISEPVAPTTVARLAQPGLEAQTGSDRVPGKTNGNMKAKPPRFGGAKYGDDTSELNRTKSGNEYELGDGTRNKRSVWTITTKGFREAHFATFPPELPETCIKAGCPPGGTVLDPFFGAGTTGLVADRLQRDCIGIELNPAYAEMARRRIQGDSPLFAEAR